MQEIYKTVFLYLKGVSVGTINEQFISTKIYGLNEVTF